MLLFLHTYILPIISEENQKKASGLSSLSRSTPRPWEKFMEAGGIEVNYPKIKKVTLQDKVELHYVVSRTIPKSYLKINIEGGLVEEPKNKIGLTNLWGSSITYSGSELYKREELSLQLEEHGSRFGFGSDSQRSSFTFSALSNFFEEDLRMVLQVINQPRFYPEDVELLKKQAIQHKKRQKERPAFLAHLGAKQVYWGSHPRGRVSTEKTITNTQPDDLKAWHKQMWVNSRITILLAGDFDFKSVIKILREHLPAEKGRSDHFLKYLTVNPDLIDKKVKQTYHISKEIPQSTIIWKAAGLPHHSKKYFAWKIFDLILGGDSFNSVLTQDIRSRQGWAYSVYSTFDTNKYNGIITISAQSRNENVKALIKRLEDILDHPEAFITDKRVKEAKTSIRNKFVFLYRTHFGFLNQVMRLRYHGLELPYLKSFLSNIKKTTTKEVIALAKEYYRSEKFFKVVVSSSKTKLPGQVEPLSILTK